MRGIHAAAIAIAVVTTVPQSCDPKAPDLGAARSSNAWFLSGGAWTAYALSDDPAFPVSGEPSTALHAVAPTADGYGTAMVVFDAAPYLGQRLRVSAPIRTEGVSARGDFWVRAQGADSPPDGPGLGGGRRSLVPTSDFASYSVEFVVSSQAVRIEVGTGIAGPGRLWVGPASWELLDGPAVADTPVGVWNVTWDRSSTGWRPDVLHGTLVLDANSVALDWTEASGDELVRSVALDGAKFRLELGLASDPEAVEVLEGVVDDEQLSGTMTYTGAKGRISPTPLRGRRVPSLRWAQ